jgi:hypothetical protein
MTARECNASVLLIERDKLRTALVCGEHWTNCGESKEDACAGRRSNTI